MSTESLVTALINANPEKGGQGAYIMDWNNIKAHAVDAKGNVFTFTIEIVQYPDMNGHVLCADMREILPHKFPRSKYTERVGHAMFVEFSCGKNVIQIRNSWGHVNESIKVDLDEVEDARVYYVWVTNFIWKTHRDGDIHIIKNKVKLTPPKWPNYGLNP